MRCPHAYRDEAQALSPSPTTHPRSGARRGWGRAQRHVERVWRAGGWGDSSGITAPLSAGLSGFLFGEENRVKSEEEKKRWGDGRGGRRGVRPTEALAAAEAPVPPASPVRRALPGAVPASDARGAEPGLLAVRAH